MCAIIVTEMLISLKFDWPTLSRPIPKHMAIFWTAGIIILVLGTVWHFYLKRLLWHTELKLKEDDTTVQHNVLNGNAHTVQNGYAIHEGSNPPIKNLRNRSRNT